VQPLPSIVDVKITGLNDEDPVSNDLKLISMFQRRASAKKSLPSNGGRDSNMSARIPVPLKKSTAMIKRL